MVRATFLCVQLLFLVGIASCVANDGEYYCVDTEQPDVVDVAKEALKFYNKQTGSECELWQVTKAETQLVAGRNYRLTFKAHYHKGCIIFDPVKCYALVYQDLQRKLSVRKIDCQPINKT